MGTTINEANQFFQMEQHHFAIPSYEKSLLYSELMFRHAAEADNLGIHVVSPFFVSCINIANNFAALNNTERAKWLFFIQCTAT